ncbi:hypothetical protein QQ045_005134 [Rhodiola kirilowii]
MRDGRRRRFDTATAPSPSTHGYNSEKTPGCSRCSTCSRSLSVEARFLAKVIVRAGVWDRVKKTAMNSRRDVRGGRMALFDGIEEGGIRASSSHEISELENDVALGGLEERVCVLKRLTGDIHEEVETHNRMLDRMGNDMDSSRGVLSGTMDKFKMASQKDGKPLISFTKAKVRAGKDRLQNALVTKFSAGRPHIDEVRRALCSAWALPAPPTIGALDARHVLVIAVSADDANTILAHPVRKINQSFFRVFRWSPDYNTRKEPTPISTWVRLPALPPHLYDQGFIGSIVSTFGRFLATDAHTKSFSNPSFAWACVEVDITSSVPFEVLIHLGGDQYHTQEIVYETKLLYYSRCKLHGHLISNSKRTQHQSMTAREAHNRRELDPKKKEAILKVSDQGAESRDQVTDPSGSNWQIV